MKEPIQTQRGHVPEASEVPVVPVAGAGTAPVRSPLRLLALRDFRIWWIGFAGSSIMDTVHAFGLGWLVVELSAPQGGGTAALYVGLLGLARAVPTLALSAFAGVTSDRYDRRNIQIVTHAALSMIALVSALLIAVDAMSIAALILLSALQASAHTFYHPARQVSQTRLVGEKNLALALGLIGSTIAVTALVGPLIGGALTPAIGVGGLMVASGIGWAAVAASCLALTPQPVDRTGLATESMLRSFVEGLRYARRTPVILWLLVVFAGTTLFLRPLPFLLPALVSDTLHVGPRQLSWLVSAAGAGALLASLILMWLRRAAHRPRTSLVVATAGGLSLVILALQHSLLATLLLVAATQMFAILCGGLVTVALQTTTPDSFRGRIVGVQNLLTDGGAEGGTFLIGTVGGALGISAALGASGGILALLYLGIAIAVPVFARGPRTPAARRARR